MKPLPPVSPRAYPENGFQNVNPTTNDVLSRIATLEARFGTLEQKTDRIEELLTRILNNQTESREAADARTEKLVFDKLEPLKEGFRGDRTKIENLEAGKRYNFATVAVIGGLLFTVFTYYSAQQQENNKQVLNAQTLTLRNEFTSMMANERSEMASIANQNKADISAVKTIVDKHSSEDVDYQNFKGVVTSQNATSITDRVDTRRDIVTLQEEYSEFSKTLSNLQAKVEQKFAEVETQFNADGQLRNLQFSEQQRMNAMHQNSLRELGAKAPDYPQNPFYQPNISQHTKGDF